MLKLGNHSEDVRTLQENLARLGFRPGKADGRFDEQTERAVILFQEDSALYADGIVGPITRAALDRALRALVDEQDTPGADSLVERSGRLPFVRVPADPHKDGYDRFHLREDIAAAYLRVREQVLEAGGKLTSSGAKRSLNARVSASRSATSFHYTGRALDLHVGSGMESPARDPYVVSPDGDRLWRVYARAPGGEQREIEAVTYRTRTRTRTTSGRFIDLTALFEAQGFQRIRARRSFFDGGTWLGAEWWHFQCETGLIEYETTFGSELLRVYSEGRLVNTPPWRYRNHVYKVDWF